MSLYVLRYHEIALKGANRDWFEKRLATNVKAQLKPLGPVETKRVRGRILVQSDGPSAQVEQILSWIPGLANFSLVLETDHQMASLAELATKLVNQSLAKNPNAQTFRVCASRADKRFPLSSQQLGAELGGVVLEGQPQLKVKMKGADLELGVEIWAGEKAILYLEKLPGQGGLPVGVSGRFISFLSGGIDSCLVLTILKLHLTKTQTLEAIYMPSKFSGELSLDISKRLCQNLKIPFYILPIEDVKMTCKSLFIKHMHQDLQGLADENIQSRIRSMLLLARANQTNSIAINTSNKSEIAVGYSTIYGDSVGAISLLGDVYKSEVYMLAKYINKAHDNIIPLEVIQRPPTAELRDNQKDTDSLPPYDILDVILEGMLSYRLTAKQMIEMGLPPDDVLSVSKLYRNSEYKRAQFCPIIKIKPKSFGFGYRVPTSKDGTFYSEI